MKAPSLVFVVGAGASKEFGSEMPVGSELAARIEQSLHEEFSGNGMSSGPIKNAFASSGGYGAKHRAAALRIRRAIHSKDSIDDLLDEWREDPIVLAVGKAAIAQVIQNAECECALGQNSQNLNDLTDAVGALRNTWLGQIIRYVGPNLPRRQLASHLKDVGFVIFNYDRCVEQMLLAELICNTDMTAEEAIQYISTMWIVHPYGSLSDTNPPGLARFGQQCEYLAAMGNGIRTYTEELHDEDSLERMSTLLSNARLIAFLGFGYHPRNMSLLQTHGLDPLKSQIMGACFQPDRERWSSAQSQLFPTGGGGNYLLDMTCADFITARRGALFGRPA